MPVGYASWIQRVGATIIDMLVYVPFYIVALFFRPTVDPQTLEIHTSPMYWVIYFLGLAAWGYNRWYLAGTTGQSWGKKALGIKLVDGASGQTIGAGKAFLRDLAHIADGFICGIGYLFPLWDEKRQTLSDKICSTVVVRL
ncbi:hypothetical protein Aiant_64930 [Actinoplanes ianthinogenes]|uniref:RDD domain-containing protein n=2 Tax=Actinoplanes ianthinogenes TaxID=122358 RepID=A0ABN6CLF1_9ACTN|nr:RDD family protein [Actinoplanes ianthinogenes]BCJ45836.1 hypothetical protein Aiant_64930 [Actinoplanes ianthinogenes]